MPDHVLGDGRVPAVNRVTPLVVIGLVDARLGDPEAAAVLAEVLATAEQSGELQRLALVGCALAELAWLRREPPPPLLRTAYAMALTSGSPWELGELARWMSRAGWLTDAVPRPDRRAVRAGDRRSLDRRGRQLGGARLPLRRGAGARRIR